MALAIVGAGSATPARAVDAPALERLAGADRYETAAAISSATFAPGVPTAFVATGENFADALAAGPAAAREGGPVLLVRRDEVPSAASGEIERLRPERIVVLGGPGVVSDAVARDLESRAGEPEVLRLFGADRYATAGLIAAHFFPPEVPVVHVATGRSFADALAAGAAAAARGGPVILLPGDVRRPESTVGLERLRAAKLRIVGGPAAISDVVEAGLREAYGQSFETFERVHGADRYETAAALSRAVWPGEAAAVFLATGEAFPDALAAAPAAGLAGAPLLLATAACLPGATAGELDRLLPLRLVVAGGAAALSARAVEERAPCPPPGRLELISGTGVAAQPALSAEGRFVVWREGGRILVRDRAVDTTELVPLATGATDASRPLLSPDGRWLAFTEHHGETFLPVLRDRVAGGQVSVAALAGLSGAATDLSADGRWLTITAGATHHLWDRDTGQLRQVPDDLGTGRGRISGDGTISGDGQRLAYPVDEGGDTQAYVYDWSSGVATLVSVTPTGHASRGSVGQVELAGDGRHVAFSSTATDLVAGGAGGGLALYLATLVGDVELLARCAPSAGPSACAPSVSATGDRVAFVSSLGDLVGGDTNGIEDVFAVDAVTKSITRYSVGPAGAESTSAALGAAVAPGGCPVAMHLEAALGPADRDQAADVYLWSCP